jgi:hypothetical protein
MPYLAFDLDAKKLCPRVAMAAGLSTGDVAWGLLELWELAWGARSAAVTRIHVEGCFAGGQRTIDALVAFGFLSVDGDGFRVKGAQERLFGIRDAQVAAGRAHAQNLKQNRVTRPGDHPGDPAGSPSGSTPALSPSTQHPAPSTEEKLAPVAKKPATRAPADPRLRPLSDTLVADFAQRRNGHAYKHGGAKDATALKALLPVATDEEIRRRWLLGLDASGWTNCSTFAQLAQKWNELGVAPRAAGKGPIDAGSQQHTGRTGWVEDF